MDDWQQTQQTTRHLHNRNSKNTSKRHGGGGGGGKSGRPFDVNRTFGTYEIKCPAAEKLSTREAGGSSGGSSSKGRGSASRLEIYTLNERGNAVVGEMMLSGVVHATVLLAGSRKVMSAVVRELEEAGDEGQEDGEEDGEAAGGADDEGVRETTESSGNEADDDETRDEESTDGDDDEDSATNQRIREFEKNSFRSPKFWLKWQGSILSHAVGSESSASDQTVTSTGYLVFSGNQCDKFQGTISCEPLDWNNVKISGWKIKSQSARDFAITWTR